MLFVCGVVIVPVLHQAGLCFPHTDCARAAESHDERGHESDDSCPRQPSHNADNCAICQLVATPTIVSCVAIQVATIHMPVQPIMPADVPVSAHLDSHPFLARGPPVLLSI